MGAIVRVSDAKKKYFEALTFRTCSKSQFHGPLLALPIYLYLPHLLRNPSTELDQNII